MPVARGCLVLGSAALVFSALVLTGLGGESRAATSAQPVSARVDPAPIVSINTQATQGAATGILITRPDGSPLFFPANAADWIQVLVLNRSTLDLVSNTSYPCPAAAANPNDAAGHQCAMDLATALRQYNASDLIIVSSPALPANAPGLGQPIGPSSAATAFASIGVTAWTFWPGDSTTQIRQGLFSAIGVPGPAAELPPSQLPAIRPRPAAARRSPDSCCATTRASTSTTPPPVSASTPSPRRRRRPRTW